MKLPFFNSYPYTNFEQLNLDKIMQLIGSFDARITSNTNRIESLEGRMDTAEVDISDLKERMTAAENDIDNLEDRMDSAEGTLDDHEDRITALEGEYSDIRSDINNLDIRVTNVEGDVTDIKGDIIDIKGDIVDIKGDIIDINGDISTITTNVNNLTTRVNNINQVSANVADTPTGTLQTLKINDTTYSVPQGGGGSGSTVVINPAGTGVADAEKIEVDGIIYDIPSNVTANPGSGSTDLTSIGIGGTNYNVQNLTVDTSLDNTSHNPVENKAVTDGINAVAGDITTINNTINNINTDLTNRGTVVSASGHGNLTTSSFLGLQLINQVIPAGTWVILVDWNTTGYTGANAVGISINLDDITHSTTLRSTGVKASASGIISTSLHAILDVNEDTTIRLKCGSGSNPGNTYACSAWLNAIRIK